MNTDQLYFWYRCDFFSKYGADYKCSDFQRVKIASTRTACQKSDA